MPSGNTSLDAAATERRARLAKLASLKRKRPDAESNVEESSTEVGQEKARSGSNKHISGRNYDIESKGPKLGFEQDIAGQDGTVEREAQNLSMIAAEQAAKDELEAEKELDLFKLQPKKPNWDLKRDLAERMKPLDIKTQNAIAKLVRMRIENAKKETQRNNDGARGEGEELGVEGNTLVEAVHLREKELEEEARREKEADIEDGVS
ncbi:hypothetical protein LTR66_016928 [Elasticomyces elasticus]|nr:hypothetical protein LTR66_016928 [Elasticomyces elasticus]